MTVPTTLPAPRRNLSDAGMAARFDDLAAADILVAAGDFTGGASEDLFTLSAHGLTSGDVLAVLGQSQQGVVSSGPATRAIAKVLSSSTFQLTTDGTTIIENTADGTAYIVKIDPRMKQAAIDALTARIIVAGNDTTGGTVEDMTSAQNLRDMIDGDTIKLLYKSAAGVAAVAVDATTFVKSPVNTVSATAVSSYFQTSATSGGAVADTTADGTCLWIKTS
jgi:hypothetical protein